MKVKIAYEIILKIKAMLAASCIVLHANNIESGMVTMGDSVLHVETTVSQLRARAKDLTEKADKIERCDDMGSELKTLLEKFEGFRRI